MTGKAGRLALVGAGSLSRSFLTRLPAVAQELGPVITPTLRLSSRVVHLLRAGYPVERYEELEDAATVLILVPEDLLPDTVSALTAAELSWEGRVALLCDSVLASETLGPLAEKGAATGSLSPIPGLSERYVVEGDRRAVRAARRLVESRHARVFELPLGAKPVFWAGLSVSGPLLMPVLDAAARCLRAAGLSASACDHVAGQLIEKTLRSYLHAGRRAWTGLPAPTELARQEEALEAVDAELAHCFRELVRVARRCFAEAGNAPGAGRRPGEGGAAQL